MVCAQLQLSPFETCNVAAVKINLLALNMEQTASIRYQIPNEGNGSKVERMLAVYGDNAPSEYQVKYWSKQFKWGRKSIEDDPRSGRPVEVTTP